MAEETGHNPNPFDFVPFCKEGPRLYTPDQLEKDQQIISGYLELQIKALTPVHIVGGITRDTECGQSSMYRQGSSPCIPASTIRGCLRSFIEAVTSGWVSQTNETYKEQHGKRHIGFNTYQNGRKPSYGGQPYGAEPAIDPAFRPPETYRGELDVASYLFGLVTTADNPHQEDNAKGFAAKGRVFVEDALLDENVLVREGYWVPDLGPRDQEAFFGGAHPSASNWWYMEPGFVKGRVARGHETAEFEGSRFRGRKFYYHQQPLTCIAEYEPGSWLYDERNGVEPYRVYLEAMEAQTTSQSFRVYFQSLPSKLLRLLVVSFLPGVNIRHKIGYAKALGYGSVELSLVDAQARIEQASPAVPRSLGSTRTINDWIEQGWYRPGHKELIDYVDCKALARLAMILGIQGMNDVIYTYPPYRLSNGGRDSTVFQKAIAWREIGDAGVNTAAPTKADAEKLWGTKRTINLELYQEKSNAWDIIRNRKP